MALLQTALNIQLIWQFSFAAVLWRYWYETPENTEQQILSDVTQRILIHI
jgi:hypothetical protein